MDRLQPAVMLMCEAVERFGGTVMRTLGDGVMALFGVPRALEGHARLACESALHMQAAFAANAQGLSIRVGLHSGLVASDPHAQDVGKGGGAHGLTIHLASRVAGVAAPGRVALTGDCHSLVRGSVDVESLGHSALKGIPEPVEIFTLAGLKTAFASQHFPQAKLTPLRGRDKELRLLQQAQRLTEAGDAQVIGVSGGPGTGKSRLCYEFAQWCRARGKPVFEVRAQLYGRATPLQPVLELMRSFFFSISAGDSPAVARLKIFSRLDEMEHAQPADLPLLSDFLGVADSEASPLEVHARARRARLLELIGAMVKHAANMPSVILIEDMHWLDEASEEFVAALVEAVASTKIMVVLNYRSSYRSPWIGVDNFEEIGIGELSAADTDALVRELISNRRELREIWQLIAKRSGGNPFFAEELVRSLAERGVLSGDPSHSNNGLESVKRAMPATVQAVIGARIDRLSESEKSLLQMCAIIGKEVPLAVLERVAGMTREQVGRALNALCHAELIQPQPASDGRRFSFGHPLIQEVAYGTQLKARRAAIHESVASAMEHFYADQLDEFSGLIAHHYEAAGHSSRAAQYEGRAAHWLSSTNSAQAIKHWRKVRSLLGEHSKDEQSDRLRAMACSQISLLGWREGLSLEDVQPFIDEAMVIANRTDGRLTQLLLMIEGRMLQASGAPADWYVERLQQALALATPEGDQGRISTLSAALSQAYGWAGLLNHALKANDVALQGVARIGRFDRKFIGFNPEQWILGMRGRLLTRLGRHEEAQQCWKRMFAVAGTGLIDPAVQVIVHLGQVEQAWWTNDVALAQEHAGLLAGLTDKNAIPYLKTVTANCQGMAKSLQRDFAGALETLQEALRLVRSDNVAAEYETEILASLAECHRRGGDASMAQVVAKQSIEISRQRCTRLPECRALITLGAAMLDEHGARMASEVDEMFAQAENLIHQTGAAIYEPALVFERSRLPRFPRHASARRTISVNSVRP